MTSLWSRFGLAIALAGLTQVGAAAIETTDSPRHSAPAHHSKPSTAKARKAAPKAPAAPAYIRQRLLELARTIDGPVGIAVKSIDDGWEAGWRDDELFPQQSVSKLWVAITVLDAVDRGKIDLSQKVTLTRDDLTLFHQPIRDEILKDGSYTTTIGDLLLRQITTSDNTANDKLMRLAGGPGAVRAMIARKHLGAIRFANGERVMQSRIAGLSWDPSYSIGDSFWAARSKVPTAKRRSAFDRYIADPYDGAAPSAIVDALARLKKGRLLSPQSTDYLLGVMSRTHTGPQRLHGGLSDGWTLNHKTGTGQEFGGYQTGYNDVGILTAPDGKSYAVAVMMKKTSTPILARMQMMSDLTRAVIEQHDRLQGVAYAH